MRTFFALRIEILCLVVCKRIIKDESLAVHTLSTGTSINFYVVDERLNCFNEVISCCQTSDMEVKCFMLSIVLLFELFINCCNNERGRFMSTIIHCN